MAVINFVDQFTKGGAIARYGKGAQQAEANDQRRRQTRVQEKNAATNLLNAKTSLKRLKERRRSNKVREDQAQQQIDLSKDQQEHREEKDLRDYGLDLERLDSDQQKFLADKEYRENKLALDKSLGETRNELEGIRNMIGIRKAMQDGEYQRGMLKINSAKASTPRGKPKPYGLSDNDMKSIRTQVQAIVGEPFDNYKKGGEEYKSKFSEAAQDLVLRSVNEALVMAYNDPRNRGRAIDKEAVINAQLSKMLNSSVFKKADPWGFREEKIYLTGELE